MPLSKPIRIAIVDDDEDDFFIINDYISEIEGNITVDWYKDYGTAFEKIKEKAYHVYFVDYRLGNQTGLDLLGAAHSIGCDDPIVLLTGKGNKAIDIQAMQYGATDYLIKSELTTENLERCIRYSLDRSNFLKELKARENKYRNLFENSKDAVFITDHNLEFIEVNKAACYLLGGCGGELPSQNLHYYLRENSQQQLIDQLLRDGSPVNDIEIRLQVPDEETKICLLSLSMQQNADERWLIHGILHDITALKKAEIATLQTEKLSANERLVRMLAHEIRNPLNNISLSTENLIQMITDEDHLRYLEILQRNSKRINQIITELLNLTKLPELSYEECSLQDIINESLEQAVDRINLQQIELQKTFPVDALPINADKGRLVLAFNNILINAIEAMEAGKGKLNVVIQQNHTGYEVSIKDNGSGIPEEHINKLFDPFFTLKKGGMGLGLAVTYSIITSHKGAINIESQAGRGTNFMVRFKREEVEG